MAGAWRGGTFKDSGLAVHVEGLAELQRAFRRIGGELPKDLRRALREMAEPIKERAKANIQHKTGRHGEESKHLADTLKIGVTQRAVSIYSNQPYASAQDQGARVGVGWNKNNPKGYHLIKRASASHYMTKAAAESGPIIEAGLQDLGDEIARRYEE